VTRPTPAALAFARSTLPVRRVASPSLAPGGFAQLLRAATANRTTAPAAKPPAPPTPRLAETSHAPMLVGGGPAPISRAEILGNAQALMNVPYVWGGTTSSGLDCSAFVSKVWGVARQTTETLASVAHPIAKDDLQPGDALNLTMAKDPDGDGHVRLFDRWANPEHTRMYVYEETPPRSVHHEISWDPKYQPMRRNNVIDG
jgi:cell wall-associated NlpC family hydrolase